MSCYNCGGCISTVTMNICYAKFTVTGLPVTTATEITFTNTADGSISKASGTTDGGGDLTITQPDMPDVIAGVNYKMELDQTWTLDATTINCAIITFEIISDKDGVLSTVNSIVVKCA